MIIKKFQGKTKEEALECAKKELGEGIVEMNVKTVKAKGLLGIFKGPKIEVTVAKEEENERYGVAQAKTSVNIAVSDETMNKANDVTGTDNGQNNIVQIKQPVKMASGQGVENIGQAVADVIASFPQTNNEMKSPKNNKISNEVKSENGLVEKIENIQTLLEKQLAQAEEKTEEKTEEKKAEEKVSDEKNERTNFLKLLYNKMIDNEVYEKYANEIIEEIDKNCKADVTMDFMLSEIYQKMILKLGKPYVMEDNGNGPRVIFFVGPTGVGKTTTIAKIASSFRVEQRKKVALLTADTYRIAAAEQLRTYANILEVPFRVVYTAKEIASTIEDFREYDYILVDTTGHSPNNEAQCENMGDLINSVETTATKEVFLVLSASTKYRDLMKIADTYKEIADYKLIFTKLDETSTLGNIYNLKMYTGAPLSYVTCGQNVPDDIENFNPQATVKQLLGGRR
ncbi:MAG: flagellar biosynthesis protein FlhF [Lachnospiraceae bacterium]|nr:flagellar biosynthesis protein FlhF [Lachnospiraceae bacterium]